MKPFTMIPNDYLEALMKRADITNREYRVLLQIMRQTYGYRTDKAKLSVRDICRGTDIDYRDIQKTLKSLEEKGLVCVDSPGHRKTKSYSLIDISKIESELIPTGAQELMPTGVPHKIKFKQRHWEVLREKSLKRANHRCERCGDNNNLHAHHIIPRSILKTGDTLDNILILCKQCHKSLHKLKDYIEVAPKLLEIVTEWRERMNKHFEEREIEKD